MWVLYCLLTHSVYRQKVQRCREKQIAANTAAYVVSVTSTLRLRIKKI